jgi:putative ABC transport system permease protein
MNHPAPPVAPSVFWLAWRQLRRDARAGQLRLLFLAVMLAVAALTAVGFFADRLNSGLARDARQMLGGDAVVASDQPPPVTWAEQARTLGLVVTRTATFPSMARAPEAQGGGSRLVTLKVVGAGYPLRGAMQVQAAQPAQPEALPGGPPPGSAWVEPALLEALGLKLGDTLLLGDASLRIDRQIIREPDRGAGFLSFSPRVMLNEQDLPATGLIQPASRVTYRLAVASPSNDDAAVARFTTWVQTQIQAKALRGLRVETLENGRPEMRQTLDRAQRFLNLVALLAALLAAVAVAIAARDFAQSHLDACAVLRVLGLSQWRIAAAYTLQFLAVGVAASLSGVLAGLVLHLGFVELLAGLVQTRLPAPSAWPALFGLGVGLTLLLGFGLPPVLQLARVPALRVLRRDLGAPKAGSLLVLGLGACGFGGLLMAVAADVKLGLITVGGFAVAVALFSLAAWGVLLVLRRSVNEARAPRALMLATRQITSRTGFTILQVSSLAVGLLALVLLVLLRTDLVASWRNATPPDAPNRFVINLQPEQESAFLQHLQQAGVKQPDWFPMIRGRLVRINGQAIGPNTFADERAARMVDREFNLSHAAQMPGHNLLAAGQWQPEEADGLSVEASLAENLKLKLGDRLAFDIAGQVREARITSLRKVDWGSMRVNFYVIFPLLAMPDVPRSYISAFRAPDTAGFDARLNREFPNITNVDVSSSVQQVQRILDQVIRAVEFLFIFTLAAGLVVLVAAVGATRETRAQEFALMRAFGASSKLLAQVQRIELAGLGALAGALASTGALAVGWALARFVFEFSWTPPLWVPLAGAAAGALLSLAAGWPSLRQVLRTPVVQTLRRAAS